MLPLFDGAGAVTHFAAIERDITDQIETKAELQRLAAADPLTGLLNRRAFLECLEEELERARRYDHHLSLIMLDIDRFKTINDTYGHNAGDLTLKTISETPRRDRAYRGSCWSAGWRGVRARPARDRRRRRRSVRRTLARPHRACTVKAEGHKVSVTASLGVAGMSGAQETSESFLSRADQAMYLAKDAGRDRVAMAQAA